MRRSSVVTAVLVCCSCAAIGLGPEAASADSIFSVNGIGETVIGVDARGAALGGAGLALTSPWNVSLENPALLGKVGRFSLATAVVPEVRRIELAGSDKSASYAYFPFLRLTHGLPGGLTAAASIALQNRVSYRLEERTTRGDNQVVEVWSGEGGPDFVALTVAREFAGRLLLGAELRVLVGTIEDERTVRIVGESSIDTRDIVKTAFGGEPLGRVGAYVDLGKRVGIGGSYQFSRVMDVTTTVLARDAEIDRTESTFHYPAMGGFGLSLRPAERATLTVEWFRSAWGTSGSLAGYRGEMTDADRFSLGLEWGVGRDYVIPLRLGYLWRELSYRLSGAAAPPTEFAVTAGFGVPFKSDNGSIDFAVQMGARGDVAEDRARERFLRFTVSMVGTEVLGHLMPGSGATP